MGILFIIFSAIVTVGILILASVGIAMLVCIVLESIFELIKIWKNKKEQKKVDTK